METLSYCQLMERCLAAETKCAALAAENAALKEWSPNPLSRKPKSLWMTECQSWR